MSHATPELDRMEVSQVAQHESVDQLPPVQSDPMQDLPLHLLDGDEQIGMDVSAPTSDQQDVVMAPRPVVDGRTALDFKATRPKTSKVIGDGGRQKTYDGLFKGANKLKMDGFQVDATADEMGLLHDMTEGAFKQITTPAKSYKTLKKDQVDETSGATATKPRKKARRPAKGSTAAQGLDEDEETTVAKKPRRKRTRSTRSVGSSSVDESAPPTATHTGSTDLIAYPGGVVLPEKLTKHPPRSFTEMRASQIIRHISEVILSQLGRSEAGAVEVEAMFVPRTTTLVIATNNLNAIEGFARDVQKQVGKDPLFADADTFLGDLIRLVATDAEKLSYRDETSLAKIDAAVHGKRAGKFSRSQDGQDARTLCELIKSTVASPKIVSHEEVAAHLDSGLPGIVLMHSSGIHAEQQLLRALLASSRRADRAIIRGARNPCFGCYLALKYAHEKLGADGLNHGDQPGFTWNGSVTSGAAIAAEELIAECNLDATRIEEYRLWLDAEIAKYVQDGANGSVVIHNRDQRVDHPPSGGLTAPYSREGLSSEGYAQASDTDDEDVNVPIRDRLRSTIQEVRTARGIEPKPPKRRKVAKDQDDQEPVAQAPVDQVLSDPEPFKATPGTFTMGTSDPKKKGRRTNPGGRKKTPAKAPKTPRTR